MQPNKFNWRIMHGIMLGFYLLGLIAFLIIGDLSSTINQILFALFLLIVIRESLRFYRRLKREQAAVEEEE